MFEHCTWCFGLGALDFGLDLLLINANSFVIERTSAKSNVQRTRIKEPRSDQFWKPTREQVAAAAGKTVRDVIAPNLRILFCGINPGLYTAAVGHHFARPGNRFWKALYQGGLTDRLLSPFDERELLLSGYGITNVVRRATAAADELAKDELTQGGKQLTLKLRRYRPRILALLGLGAYRSAFAQANATVGRQQERIANTIVWVLPNPSGLNANYQQADLARLFSELRAEVEKPANLMATQCPRFERLE